MSSRTHGPEYVEMRLSPIAAKQIDAMGPAALLKLDRAMVAMSIDPDQGDPIPNTWLRQYRTRAVRIIYQIDAPRSVVILAYAEA